MQLYDSNKKGTIIVGHMRSGTHYLMSLLKNEFLINNMTYTYNVEYFGDMYGPINNTEDKYSFFNIIDRLKNQDKSSSYSLGSIVFPNALDMLSQSKINYQYLMENYHIVKMIRKGVSYGYNLACYNAVFSQLSFCIIDCNSFNRSIDFCSLSRNSIPSIPYKLI